ncbi:MAG: adenylosuccinate lyase [Proteobacteria bacterium]|nr:adenylosuccinate lyase [Pseudomonadota bacterium]
MNQIYPIQALSPLDGRYHHHCQELQSIASEYGLMRYRFIVEVKWLQTLAQANIDGIPALSTENKEYLEKLIVNFNAADANAIKAIELNTNHDVKAVEYYLKEKLSAQHLDKLLEYVHFACTSEDINNLSYGLMMQDIRNHVLIPQLEHMTKHLRQMAHELADIPMLSRTHGQAATPTTVGKEIANLVARISRQIKQLKEVQILGKINGAVGNYNAHVVAFPQVNWPQLAEEFVGTLGLTFNPYTIQIEPHDAMAEYFHCLMRINTILIDMCRDFWSYISLGYFTQKVIATEVGSSTMPHKVNPIQFENAEGNFGVANALLAHFAEKLPISRLQRDLSDSTVLRNIGVACGYMLIAIKSLHKGIQKLAINEVQLSSDLNDNWEVLSEAIQTVMRRFHIPEPYEKLKALTRGKKINQALLHQFIETLDLPPVVKKELKALTPSNYIGLANVLAQSI